MEFRLERATPDMATWARVGGTERVVIINRAKKPVLASGSLMAPQVEAVVEAHAAGKDRVRV